MAQFAQDRHLRHAFRIRVGVFVAAGDGNDIAARTPQCRGSHRRPRAARRVFSNVGRLCRLLPQGVARAGPVASRKARVMSSLQTPPLSAEQAAPDSRTLRLVRILLPFVVLAAGIAIWGLVVRLNNIPPFVLPGRGALFVTLVADWPVLSQSLLTTLLTTLEGFAAAALGGIALALVFNQSKWLEYSLFPYAVILQVTPVIAIAPLLLIYLSQQTAVIVCAWIVGFFPVLSNTTLGLNSVDRTPGGLVRLYGPPGIQTLAYLKLPSALPFILGR